MAMRVLLLSTSYPHDIGDWRGIFIRHLTDALARTPGIQLSVWAPPGELPNNVVSATTADEAEWLDGLMKSGGISHLIRLKGLQAATSPIKLLRMLNAAYQRHTAVDVYHINWLQCALPLQTKHKPALITVLGNDLKLLRLPFMRTLLRQVMRRRKVAICPNAEWMVQPLRDAFGSVAQVIPVSFGIDPSWYAIQRDLSQARPKRWLVVTRLTADKLGPLFEWSEGLFRNTGRELHLFGPMQEGIVIPKWIHYHGAATPHQLATEWFPTAHGLITLSRHAEGRPQVMLEAMASGLPIIASNMPAHATIVHDGQTGVLCSTPESYSSALDAMEDPLTNVRHGQAARYWAIKEIGTWDDCAQRYIRIYRELLEASRHG
jgi:glycosyltransferase involved in cell wall biosynthesis